MAPRTRCLLWSFFFVVLLLVNISFAIEERQAQCDGVNALSPSCQSRESLHYRDFFYIGGRYTKGDSGPTTGTVLVDQVYVEKLTPALGVRQPRPVIFVHPGGTSGASWLNTPDNRKGFASFFLDLGYQVYLLDTQAVGRSSENDVKNFPLTPGSTIEEVERGYTAPETANLYPTAKDHDKWPGVCNYIPVASEQNVTNSTPQTGLRGDPTFEAFAGSIIPVTTNNIALETALRAAGCQLLQIIGPAFVVAHSFGSFAPILWSNDCPHLVLGSVNLEPANTPFQLFVGLDPATLGSFPTRPWGLTNTRLDYVPPVSDPKELATAPVGEDTRERRRCILQVEPARKLPNVASVPYLALTSNASVHVTWDHCIVEYLRQVGASPEWYFLDDLGITGHGLFMHLELGNLEIAKVVHEWIVKTLYGFGVSAGKKTKAELDYESEKQETGGGSL